MKYSLACAMFAASALIDSADARVRTTWGLKKINATKHRLERNYGKGLVGLINENGHVSPDRLDWMMSSRIGGKPLVSGKRNLLNATFENLGVT